MAKKIFILLIILGVAAGFGLSNLHSAKANTLTPLEEISGGDLIRGETFPAVYYYGVDGFRYVFPNDKTYFTWYDDFDDVKWISDSDLTKIQIGGNVTYRPGVRMVKIDSDPKTYAVDKNGELRHVTSESAASELYGADWNQMIDDVPDSYFGNYHIGDNPINSAADFDIEAAKAASPDIAADKDLVAPAEVTIFDGDYTPSTITIDVNTNVRFSNSGDEKHTVTAEDLTWGSGTMNSGENYIKKFTEAGNYYYFDSYNPDMSGVVIVEE